jgi:hypothetical protein
MSEYRSFPSICVEMAVFPSPTWVTYDAEFER